MRKSRKSDEVSVEATTDVVPIDLTIKSRPRDRDRTTRRKLSAWDRCKYTLLLGGLFVFYWWQKIDDNPIKSVNDAFWETVRSQSWIFVLLLLEWIRQIHFLIAEHSSRYYHFWKVTVFGRFEGRSERLDPWTRYRIARVMRWIFALLVVSVVVGQITDLQVVLSVANAIDRWDFDSSKGSFRGWLFRIARNLMVNFWKRRQRQPVPAGRSRRDVATTEHGRHASSGAPHYWQDEVRRRLQRQ